MEKHTLASLREKTWYRTLRALHVLFVVFCYLVALLFCVIIFTDGTDGINVFLKIASVPIFLFIAWIIGNTPQQIFFYILGLEGFRSHYSKIRMIIGVCVGCIIAISAIALIFPVDDQKTFTSGASAASGSPQFIETLSMLTGGRTGTGQAVIPIDKGATFLPILLNALNAASSSIDFTTFPWADGTFNNDVFTALVNATDRGVQVRLLLDAFGSHSLSKDYVRRLEAAGGKVAEYHPFDILDPLQYDSRDHIRSIVIDGTTGFTGGMGITNEWFGEGPDNTFEDMMFEVKGTMAESLQDSFAEIWNDTTGEVLSGPAFYPPVPDVSGTNSFIGITSIPSGDYEPVRDAFLLTAASAQKKLYIAASYIIPDRDLLKTLEDKARDGVDVRIVSPGGNTVAPILRDAWHLDYSQLLAAGVKIYEYQPSMIHTKFMVADDTWSLIGSANIDNRSEAINTENLLGVSDPALARSLDGTFTDYLSRSKEITASSWKGQYGFFSTMYSRLLLILNKQY